MHARGGEPHVLEHAHCVVVPGEQEVAGVGARELEVVDADPLDRARVVELLDRLLEPNPAP
jgi:hypothetical protein